jgi:DNA-binding MarR family transcriptional regulator
VVTVNTPPSVEAELGWALSTIMRSYLRVAGESVAGVPGGPRGYLVLATIGQGEPSTQLALAQHLGVDRTVMTYLLDDLEDAGLVERRPDPADRRARRVSVTQAGLSRLNELRCGLHKAEDGLLEPLETEERAVLRDLLHRLATTMAPGNPCQMAEQFAGAPTEVRGRRRRR